MKKRDDKAQEEDEDDKIAEFYDAGEEQDAVFGWLESSDSKSTDSDVESSISQDRNSKDDNNNNNSSSVEMKLRQKKALLDFRCIVEDAILGNYILENPKPENQEKGINKKKSKPKQRDISLWGIPLLPSKCHESTDFVLLRFLKAKDFKVEEAFDMLQKTLIWRKEFNTDVILEENLNVVHAELENVMFMNNVDRKGHPLFYAGYGAFKDKGLYKKVLGSEESRERFLRWKVQLMEKCAQNISLKGGEEADSILQITDFKNNPGPEMKELRSVIKKYFMTISTNYPEFIYKNILINVPFWYYTSYCVSKKFKSPGAKRKLVVARRSKVTRTLLKYIAPENIPIEYGGLRRQNDAEFSEKDVASELIIRANSSGCITVPVYQGGVTMIWDFTVVGWEVTCKEEFIPDDEGSYRVVLRKYKEKEKKMGESIRNSFYIYEPGKLVITIDNSSLKKKRTVYYRSKTKPYLPTYAHSNK